MNISQTNQTTFIRSLDSGRRRQDISYLFITIFALAAFEIFNFSTNNYALSDLLGDAAFLGVRWATFLALAFCGIDFAGIVRLFSSSAEKEMQRSGWYMFGAWFLAGTMNAILTWWGVVMSIRTHTILNSDGVEIRFVNEVVPVLIALMVWVIRVLLIGSLSRKNDQGARGSIPKMVGELSRRELRQAQSRAAHSVQSKTKHPLTPLFNTRPFGKTNKISNTNRPEPTYIPMPDEAPQYPMNEARIAQRRG